MVCVVQSSGPIYPVSPVDPIALVSFFGPVDPVGSVGQVLGCRGKKAGGGQGTVMTYDPKSFNGMKSIVEDDVAVGSTKAERIDRDPS